MGHYGVLRIWSYVLLVLGILVVVGVAAGIIGMAVRADSFLDGLFIVLIGGPIAILLSIGTIAVAQAINALLDIHERVEDLASRRE